jgi:hypothetical protein
VAFFSKKLTPAEANYEIHDKELLAIVKSVQKWRGELMSLGKSFTIFSDHRNLTYFMTKRQLTERQIRWSHTLSEHNFRLKFRTGSKSGKPDALSRREQDFPRNGKDERLTSRKYQLIKEEWVLTEDSSGATENIHIGLMEPAPKDEAHYGELPRGRDIFAEVELQTLWDRGLAEDPELREAYRALRTGERNLPHDRARNLGISLAECEIDPRGVLLFRHKVVIPNWEPLRTALVQKTHDSHITGHPGRDNTLAILSRGYFWAEASKTVRRFCANCDVCGRSHVWRERKKGLLLPLPIPERFYCELSIDFITDLPARKKGDPRYLMVITDRLAKTVTLEDMITMDAPTCAKKFVRVHWRYHGFPKAITSDKGSNWMGDFWTHLCKLVGIEQRLSTAFHPQTDGATERMNQEVLGYLRAFISYSQYEWKNLLPMAMLAINNRNTGSGFSPFFATHGYHADPVQEAPALHPKKRTDGTKAAEAFVARLHEGWELAQAVMAAAQQRMEERARGERRAQDRFEMGDRVWLSLKNISTPQLSKKLSWTNAKYTVTKIISPHVVELNVPSKIHPRFHVDLLKRASTNPLPSQKSDDKQPPPLFESSLEEANWEVEEIIRAENRPVGRGHRRQVLVKWKGYAKPTWEPREEFENKDALQEFVQKYGGDDGVGQNEGAKTGPKARPRGRKRIAVN